MSGRLQRILGRRAAAAKPPQPPPVSPDGAAQQAPDGRADQTPAGAVSSSAPALLDRSRMRRRLRFLRRTRELQLRDLGGLVFDLHRFGATDDEQAHARHRDIVDAKVEQLEANDRELRALERMLDDRQPLHEVRMAGIGGTCERCGALHGSDASFCSSCGAPVVAGGEDPSPAPESKTTAGAGDAASAPTGASPTGPAPVIPPEADTVAARAGDSKR